MWLYKFLKSPLSEDPLTSNMVTRLKHVSNLNVSTFTTIIYKCEGNSAGKSLSELYAKS